MWDQSGKKPIISNTAKRKYFIQKTLPCCISRGPRRGFIFPSFHYRTPVWPFKATRCSHTTSQLHGESQALCLCPAVACCSGMGQHRPRRAWSPNLCCQNPNWTWQLREGMPQKPQGNFPTLVNPWEALPASQAFIATSNRKPDLTAYL